MNTASDWIFNLMIWGAIVGLVVLTLHVFVTPILSAAVTLVGLAIVVVASAFWPKW